MKVYGGWWGVGIDVTTKLVLNLGTRWRWVVSASLTSEERSRYPFNRNLGGPQSRSGRYGKWELNHYLSPVQCLVWSLYRLNYRGSNVLLPRQDISIYCRKFVYKYQLYKKRTNVAMKHSCFVFCKAVPLVRVRGPRVTTALPAMLAVLHSRLWSASFNFRKPLLHAAASRTSNTRCWYIPSLPVTSCSTSSPFHASAPA
jgi:hypothetical protein